MTIEIYKQADTVLLGDLERYCDVLVKIKHKESGALMRFTWNNAQRRLHSMLEVQKRKIGKVRALILKYRQGGISTYVAARFYNQTSTQFGRKTYILTHEDQATQNLFNMAKRIHENMPSDYRPAESAKNANQLKFGNLDSEYAIGTARNIHGGGRSSTIHTFHGSEICFWPQAETHFSGVMQAIPDANGTEVILETTGNGPSGEFYDQWRKAEAGKSEFAAIFLPWMIQDEYRKVAGNFAPFEPSLEEREYVAMHGIDAMQLAWMHYKNIELGATPGEITWLFRQEYPACVTGDTRVGTEFGLIPIREARKGMKATRGEIVASHPQIPSPIYTLTTSMGYQVRGTWDHPVFSSGGVLVPLAACDGQAVQLLPPKLADSYHTASWTEHGVQSSITFDENWGRLLGLFMGDGSMYGYTLSFACAAKDMDVVQEVKRLLRVVLDLDGRERIVGDKKGCIEVRVQSKAVGEIFGRMGLARIEGNTTKRLVHVPEVIWRSPRSVVREFLRGLFEADGFNATDAPRIVFFSKYPKFIQDVQLLLLAFGVTSKQNHVIKKSGVGQRYEGHELRLRSQETHAFCREIGFLSHRKDRTHAAFKGRGRPPMPLLLQDAVVSVVEDGFEETFDLTVQDGESFDANGIHTHNTAAEAFQAGGDNPFISPKYIMEARRRKISDEVVQWAPIVLGVDIARNRGAGDASHIIDRQGRRMGQIYNHKFYSDNTMEVADEVIKALVATQARMAFLDVTGLGAGVYDRCVQLGYSDRVAAVNFGQKASDPEKFLNKRAEMWWLMENWFKDVGGCQCPDDDEFHRHVAAPIWGPGKCRFDSNSVFQLESKESIAQRLKFSPDGGDAGALTFAQTVYDADADTRPEWAKKLLGESAFQTSGSWMSR